MYIFLSFFSVYSENKHGKISKQINTDIQEGKLNSAAFIIRKILILVKHLKIIYNMIYLRQMNFYFHIVIKIRE